MAKPGDQVAKGQPLFVIEAADTVQAQNDFISAMTGLNKAKSALDLAQMQDTRAKDLFEGKAVPLKDYQQSQATLIQAQNDMRSSQTALEAARNKLHILGFTDDAIASFQDKGRHQSEHHDLLADRGHRRAAQGRARAIRQFWRQRSRLRDRRSLHRLAHRVRPRNRCGDRCRSARRYRSTCWRCRAAPLPRVSTMSSAAIDPTTRRLLVRATVDNKDGLLKPEMFANVTIYSSGEHPAVGVPKQALIYEGDQVRLWVAHEDKSIELRQIKTGLINGNLVEVDGNLKPGEQIVTKGSLFIDRAASGS